MDSNPDDIVAWINLGKSYKHLNQYENAIDALENVIKHDPNNAIAMKELGIVYYNNEKYDEVVEVCQEILEFDSKYIEVWRILGSAYEKKGLHTLAEEAFEKARKLKDTE